MDDNDIKARIKSSIAQVTGIGITEITDSASYKEDLALDSLAILEVLVDLEYQFQIKVSQQVPQEELSSIKTVDDTVKLLKKYLPLEVA